MTENEWLAWARGLVRRCCEAENRIRERFGLAEEAGLQDPEAAERWDEDDVRESVERWAEGNISARADCLRARGLREKICG